MSGLMERIRNDEVLVSDGATGTFLQGRGLAVGEAPDSEWMCEDVHGPRQMTCRVRGAQPDVNIAIESNGDEDIPEEMMAIEDSGGYWDHMEARKVSAGFWDACAEAISQCAATVRVVESLPRNFAPSISIWVKMILSCL